MLSISGVGFLTYDSTEIDGQVTAYVLLIEVATDHRRIGFASQLIRELFESGVSEISPGTITAGGEAGIGLERTFRRSALAAGIRISGTSGPRPSCDMKDLTAAAPRLDAAFIATALTSEWRCFSEADRLFRLVPENDDDCRRDTIEEWVSGSWKAVVVMSLNWRAELDALLAPARIEKAAA